MSMSTCFHERVGLDDETDIGDPVLDGGTKRKGRNSLDVEGGGRTNTDTYTSFGLTDDFHFAYKEISGNFRIIARMTLLNGDFQGKAGIMVRESLEAGAVNVFAQSSYAPSLDTFNQVVRGERETTNGGTSNLSIVENTNRKSVWFRIDRVQDDVVAYYAVDNGSCELGWIEMSPQNPIELQMSEPIFVGLAVASLSDERVEKASFDNVAIESLA